MKLIDHALLQKVKNRPGRPTSFLSTGNNLSFVMARTEIAPCGCLAEVIRVEPKPLLSEDERVASCMEQAKSVLIVPPLCPERELSLQLGSS